METVLDMAKTGKDSIDVNRLDLGDIYYVGIDWKKAMLKPGSSADIVLREGTVIEIPDRQQHGTYQRGCDVSQYRFI